MIDWRSIADMPSSLKDGREVLLGSKTDAAFRSEVCVFDIYEGVFITGIDGLEYQGASHFAEINPPT